MRRHRHGVRRKLALFRGESDLLRRDLYQLRVSSLSVGHLLGLEHADVRGSVVVVVEMVVGLVDGKMDLVEARMLSFGRRWNHVFGQTQKDAREKRLIFCIYNIQYNTIQYNTIQYNIQYTIIFMSSF